MHARLKPATTVRLFSTPNRHFPHEPPIFPPINEVVPISAGVSDMIAKRMAAKRFAFAALAWCWATFASAQQPYLAPPQSVEPAPNQAFQTCPGGVAGFYGSL